MNPFNYIHNRHSIRLKKYDYSTAGLYFITLCCQDRLCRFGEIIDSEMKLNEIGLIAGKKWQKLPERFSTITLDVFQIMPNHIHGIIILNDVPVGAGLTPAQSFENPPARSTENTNCQNNIEPQTTITGQPQTNITGQPQGLPLRPTIGQIVGAYKSLVANGCLEIYKKNNQTMGKFWQRNYYERIIRDESSHYKISEYIINNPIKWKEDMFLN